MRPKNGASVTKCRAKRTSYSLLIILGHDLKCRKMKKYLLFAMLGLTAFLFMSSSGGRAATQNMGNTGAPGESSTCANQYCHGNTDIQVMPVIELFDLNGNAISGNLSPQETYSVKVTVNHVGGNTPSGYGFQMVVLDDDTETSINTFANPSENAQVATINSGRQYAEHDGVSSINEFTVEWTAPSSGTSVTFYAAGNGVNANGNSQGDGANNTSLQFDLDATSPIKEFSNEWDVRIYPNPVKDQMHISMGASYIGMYQLSILNVVGQEMIALEMELQSERNFLNVEHLPKGYYSLVLLNKGKKVSIPFIKE